MGSAVCICREELWKCSESKEKSFRLARTSEIIWMSDFYMIYVKAYNLENKKKLYSNFLIINASCCFLSWRLCTKTIKLTMRWAPLLNSFVVISTCRIKSFRQRVRSTKRVVWLADHVYETYRVPYFSQVDQLILNNAILEFLIPILNGDCLLILRNKVRMHCYFIMAISLLQHHNPLFTCLSGTLKIEPTTE